MMHRPANRRPRLALAAISLLIVAAIGCAGDESAPPERDLPSTEEQQPIVTEDFESGETGALSAAGDDDPEPEGESEEEAPADG